MKVIIGGRQTGKTTKLVKECLERGGVILVGTYKRAEWLLNKFGSIGLKNSDVYVADKYILRGLKNRPVYFDDLDCWLLGYLGMAVDTATCWDRVIGDGI